MTLEIIHHPEKKELTVRISGRFDFSVHQDFRKATEWDRDTVKTINVDLRHTEYMDSSALGMLLILRDKMNNNPSAIRLLNANPEVKKILEIANFQKLFTLVP